MSVNTYNWTGAKITILLEIWLKSWKFTWFWAWSKQYIFLLLSAVACMFPVINVCLMMKPTKVLNLKFKYQIPIYSHFGVPKIIPLVQIFRWPKCLLYSQSWREPFRSSKQGDTVLHPCLFRQKILTLLNRALLSVGSIQLNLFPVRSGRRPDFIL